MGEAADRKLREIAETRRRLEADMHELEERLPPPLRSLKTLAGSVAGSAVLSGVALRAFRKRSDKRSNKKDRTEVVVRVVRDDDAGAIGTKETGKT